MTTYKSLKCVLNCQLFPFPSLIKSYFLTEMNWNTCKSLVFTVATPWHTCINEKLPKFLNFCWPQSNRHWPSPTSHRYKSSCRNFVRWHYLYQQRILLQVAKNSILLFFTNFQASFRISPTSRLALDLMMTDCTWLLVLYHTLSN